MKAVITTYEEKSQFNIVLDTETDDEKDTLERLYNILRSVKKPILKTAYLSARYPNSRSKCNRVSFGVEVE